MAFPAIHADPDRPNLPRRGRVDVGRRVAQRPGVQGLRRFNHCTQHRRMGSPGGRNARGAQAWQVPERRPRQANASIKRTCGNPGRLHPLVWLVRLQRRIAAGVGERAGCGGDEPCPGQHQSGGGGRRHGRSGSLEANPGAHGPLRRTERGDSRACLYHRGTRHHRALLGRPL